MERIFFTFLDGSLAYDCVRCGQACCRGFGLDLDRAEIVRFARLEPRLALLLRHHDADTGVLIEPRDGCWMLQKDGWCGIETTLGRAEKPLTCRLFPFNRIFTVGGTRFVDFASVGCPLFDASATRGGQSWKGLADELQPAWASPSLEAKKAPPPGSAPFQWLELETRVRDAIALHLDQPDYAEFAAVQEEEVLALSRKRPPPDLRSSPRAGPLRTLLGKWRALMGVREEGGPAARAAAREVALLTSHFRLKLLLGEGAPPYTLQLQRLPRVLLATAFLAELGHLGRRGGQSLRTASETFTDAAAIIDLLSLFDRRARLKSPLDPAGVSVAARPALQALSEALLANAGTLSDCIGAALAPFEPHLRGLALSALAFGEATLQVDPR